MEKLYQGKHTQIVVEASGQQGNKVARKILNAERPDVNQITRFYTEFENLIDLDIEGVRKVIEKDVFEGRSSMRMEYVDGLPFNRAMEGKSLNDVLQVAARLCDIIGKTHQRKIIHKDINPNNILVNPETGRVSLIDFGIASKLSLKNENLGNPDHLEGTLHYISPEQTGRMNRAVDYRSDLYSLGVTLYEVFTHRLPFSDDDSLGLVHAHIAKIATSPLEINPDLPPALSFLIEKLMQKNAEDRYLSAFGVKDDLERIKDELESGTPSLKINFSPGQNDFSGIFETPQKLYGRGGEIVHLMDTFARVSEGERALMWVKGYSGVGKSALVAEIHKPITEKRGYFISGKFDQYQRNIPYSAFQSAFEKFVDLLLTEKEEVIERWRQKILDAVGNSGAVLTEVIPGMEDIIGKQPEVPQLSAQENQIRFNQTFLAFLKAAAAKEHPLVVFNDDWQWADNGSLELLKLAMTDAECQYLFFIGAYRDNEVDVTHPLVSILKCLDEEGCPSSEIKLENLTEQDVNHLVGDALGQAADELTGIVYEKTRGNAFFTLQFLNNLSEEGLLRFDYEQKRWTWDAEQITAMGYSDNVVELMANKIKKMPLRVQEALKLAACIGNTFDLDLLSHVSGMEVKEELDNLWPAIEQSLIIPTDSDFEIIQSNIRAGRVSEQVNLTFRFVHDRVQQAAYSLILEGETSEIHLRIGRIAYINTSEEDLHEAIFDIVNQLNQGLALVESAEEKERIARLNLDACHKAKQANALSAANVYLDAAISCLGEDAWSSLYDLTYGLYYAKVDITFLLGAHEESASLYELVKSHELAQEDMLKLLILKVNQGSISANYEEAIKTGFDALRLFDKSLPEPNEADAIEKVFQEEYGFYLKVKESGADLYNPQLMEGNLDKMKAELISSLIGATIVGNIPAFQLMALKGLRLAITKGNFYLTPFFYMTSGVVLASRYFMFKEAYELSSIGLKVYEEKFPTPALLPQLMSFYTWNIHQWVMPPLTTIDYATRGFNTAKELGNKLYEMYLSPIAVMIHFFAGTPIEKVIDESDKVIALSEKNNSPFVGAIALPIKGESMAMQGETDDMLTGNHEGYDEEQFLEAWAPVNMVTGNYYSRKFRTYYITGNIDKIIDLGEKVEGLMLECPAQINISEFFFYYALAANKEVTTDEDVLARRKRCEEFIDTCVDSSAGSFAHKKALLQAEKARLAEDNWKAMSLYKEAIIGAKENGFMHEEALANEMLGEFWLATGMASEAEPYLKAAHDLYKSWGAKAKAKQMVEKHGRVFSITPSTVATTKIFHPEQLVKADNNAMTDDLDVKSILKAGQSLSESVKIKQLAERMLYILIENAGATKAGLVIKSEGNWFLEAVRRVDRSMAVLDMHEPIETTQEIGVEAVKYVVRSGRMYSSGLAYQEDLFSSSEYFQANQTKSLLVMPITYKSEINILIYLENNVADNVFNREQIDVLKMLASQLAISWENASLYENLESKVTARTEQVVKQKEEIENKNKNITASIKYASQIQNAILPVDKEIGMYFDHFVYYKPKDIVSGDFYWFYHDSDTNEHFIAVVDCTGHGVPGAFMSMLGFSMLNRLVAGRGVSEPHQILESLDELVRRALRQEANGNLDGMDLVLCSIKYLEGDSVKISYAGAKRPLHYFVKDDAQLQAIEPTRRAIGGHESDKPFELNELYLPKGTMLYLSTDGFQDQNNRLRKSFGKSKYLGMLNEIAKQPTHVQRSRMEEMMEAHKSTVEQRDDMTVVGIRL